MFCFANEMLCYTATCILGQLKKRRYQNYTFCQIYNFERGNKIYYIPNAIVVYLHQFLGAVHSNCWSKHAFSRFFVQKS